MNREIKFRAWDKKSKCMAKLIGFKDLGKAIQVIYLDEDGDETFAIVDKEQIELMQYTGLKDKNSKEIYERDIIEGGYLNPLTSEFLSRKYVVEYDKGSFKGKLIGHTPYGDTWLQFINGEVIGNIYEDKHWLEGEK